MKEELKDLLEFTYKRSVNDNKEDFMVIYGVISKLCSVLKYKKILNDEEIKIILDTDNLFKSEVE